MKRIASDGKEKIRSVGTVKWKQEKTKPTIVKVEVVEPDREPMVVKVAVTEPNREPIVAYVRVAEPNYDEKSLSEMDE